MTAIIGRPLLLFAFLLFISLVTNAQTINAASCSQTDVQKAFNSVTASTTTVNIPAGSCIWTTQVTLSVPSGSTTLMVMGQSSIAATNSDGNPATFNDTTTITDGYSSTSSLLSLTTAGASSSFRLSGLTFKGGSEGGNSKSNGIVHIGGFSQGVRVDHIHIDETTYSPAASPSSIQFDGWMYGVVDHNLIDTPAGQTSYTDVRVYLANWGGSQFGFGDDSWATASNLSSGNFIFMENNTFNNGISNDCKWGGRMVIRYNTLNAATMQTHGTGQEGSLPGTRERGCRVMEIYNNHFIASNSSPIYNAMFWSSGTGLSYNNAAPTGYESFVNLISIRHDPISGGHPQAPTPNGWGFCGPSPIATGTVNTSGTAVTYTSGTQFNASWPANLGIIINGASYKISSVNSTTSITLSASAGTQTGVSFEAGSLWDQNSTAAGAACMDNPGRGQGDLLANDFPNIVDTVSGKIQWPNQATEPIYEWLDTWAAVPGFSGGLVNNNYTDQIVQSRDYFPYAASFNGTSGVGVGSLLPSDPSAYTNAPNCSSTIYPGPGYWDTANNTLYVCTALNTWTAYYAAYTYPHPLTQASGTSTTIAPPSNLAATVQ